MTFKASAASIFVLLLALAATTLATPSFADGDKHSERVSDNGSDNNGAAGEVENEANDDNGGVIRQGGKVSGIDCTVTRSDGVKVFC